MQLGHTVDGERICRHDLFDAPTLALRQDDISRSRLLAPRRRAGPCIVVIGQVLAVVGKVFLRRGPAPRRRPGTGRTGAPSLGPTLPSQSAMRWARSSCPTGTTR